MQLQEMISAYRGKLTPADRRLVDLLLADPTAAAMSSATELAARADVHAASLVRLAKKLGFEGFPDLRARLREAVIAQDLPADRLRRRVADIPPEAVLESVIAQERAALVGIMDHVGEAQIRDAAARLAGARRVTLFAEGTARQLAALMADRLRRLGFLTDQVAAEPREMASALTGMDSRDVLLAFAFARTPRLLPGMLRETAALGATSILLSDMGGPLLRPAPDVLLAAPRGPNGQSQTLIVPLAICQSILLALTMREPDRMLDAAGRYGAIRRRLEGGLE